MEAPWVRIWGGGGGGAPSCRERSDPLKMDPGMDPDNGFR